MYTIEMRAELDPVSVSDVPPLDSLEAPPSPFDVRHAPPAPFAPGAPLHVEVGVQGSVAHAQLTLHYRHVNQAEPYECVPMREMGSGQFVADGWLTR